jgi:hypothetical protein
MCSVASLSGRADDAEMKGRTNKMKYATNTIKFAARRLSFAAILTTSSLCAAVVHADDLSSGKQPDRYAVTNLVSDINGLAPTTDAVLQNAWGVAFSPAASPFWGLRQRYGVCDPV